MYTNTLLHFLDYLKRLIFFSFFFFQKNDYPENFLVLAQATNTL